MKRFSFAMGLVAATMFAAPLAAQSRNDGPWWDHANTGSRGDNRSGTVYDRDGRVYDRNGSVYGRNGSVYDNRVPVDGRWHLAGRDRNGNNVYVRRRYDNNGNVIQEAARRNSLGRYSVFDRQVVSVASNRNRVYDRRDNDRNHDGWEDRRSRNDRWDQNNGHDNGKHNGKYKKNKNQNKNRRD